MAAKKIWKIEGYDSSHQTFEGELPSSFSEKEIIVALQRLVARHLTEEEILASSLRRNSANYQPLLEPQIDSSRDGPISVGINPYYIAKIRAVRRNDA